MQRRLSAMKLSIYVSHLVPTYGLERVIIDVVNELQQHYDLDVVQISGQEIKPGILDSNVQVITLGTPLLGLQRFKMLSRLRRFDPKDEADMYIVAGTWAAIPWLLVAPRRRRKRTLVWEHSILRERSKFSKKTNLLSAIACAVYKRAAAVVAVSEPVAEDIRAYPRLIRPRQVAVIPNPVISDGMRMWSQPGNKISAVRHETVRLVTVGALTRLKSQHLAVRSLVHLGPKYHLEIVGDGIERKALEQLSANLGVASQVTFSGQLSRQDVQRVLSHADLMVHCSVGETFGLVFSEAANSGLPVVATSSRVADLMIPKYVPGRTSAAEPFALAQAIKSELREGQEENIVAAAQAKRVEDHSPPVVIEAWRTLIEDSYRSTIESAPCSQGQKH